MLRGILNTLSQQIRAASGLKWTSRNLGNFRPRLQDPGLSPEDQSIVDQFSDLYYSRWDKNRAYDTIPISWMGYQLLKCPLDLWTYQEIIVEKRPDYIIETGTFMGGSALFFANIFDLIGNGEVLSIDIDESRSRPKHPRITYLAGSSTNPAVVDTVRRATANSTNRLVVLDSDHSMAHVLAELRIYREFVPTGSYLVVEDTNVNGHPSKPDFGPGPWEAVDAFLAEDKHFEADRARERFMLTMNPRGFLRRRHPA